MTCEHGERCRDPAVCDRYARKFRGCNGRANTRDDLEWNPVHAKAEGLFSASSEYEWVTALEPNYVLPGLRQLDK